MHLCEDENGRRLAVVKRSATSSLVLDLETGDHFYRANETLTPIDNQGTGNADTGSNSMGPTDQRAELLSILEHDPIPIRTILSRTTLCESDLYAIRRELEVAGVLEEVTINGERAWVLASAGKFDDDSAQS